MAQQVKGYVLQTPFGPISAGADSPLGAFMGWAKSVSGDFSRGAQAVAPGQPAYVAVGVEGGRIAGQVAGAAAQTLGVGVGQAASVAGRPIGAGLGAASSGVGAGIGSASIAAAPGVGAGIGAAAAGVGTGIAGAAPAAGAGIGYGAGAAAAGVGQGLSAALGGLTASGLGPFLILIGLALLVVLVLLIAT